MFDATIRTEFSRRIRTLRPDAQRRWGRMNAQQMICHLADQLRITLGEIPAKRVPSPLRYFPVKQLVIYVLPWPKGRIKGPPEAFLTQPDEWERDIATLLELLDRFGKENARQDWPPHPAFGDMSGALWNQLSCRHFDHHLTQFGV